MSERRSPGRYKSKFSPDEDARLLEIVSQTGCQDWLKVAAQLKGRNPRQCRERWNNYVNPSITTAPWTDIEEHLLESKFAELGPRWHVIAPFFPGRSRNQVKNHWMTKQRRVNKRRKEEQEPIARDQRKRTPPPPVRRPGPPEELFQPEAKDDAFWDIIGFD
jgi:hypothetical protein